MRANTRDFITIVSGLPRSGTSMMMQMIAAGGVPALTDDVRQADVDNPKGYYEFEPVKRTKQDPSWLKSAGGKVVKMVHVLLLDLPPGYEYRVIFMRRNLEEVVASQDVMLERRGKATGTLAQEKLIETFRGQIEQVQGRVREQPGFKLLEVDYNTIIRDPAPTVRAINEFLGGALNTEAMLKTVDPSLYRQRK